MKFFKSCKAEPFANKIRKRMEKKHYDLKSPNYESFELIELNKRDISLRFYLKSYTHNKQPFDIDNLVEPVLYVFVNEKGYLLDKRSNIKWWYASKILSQHEGVEIEIKSLANFNSKISSTKKIVDSNFIYLKIMKIISDSSLSSETIIDETYKVTIPTLAKSPELSVLFQSKGLKPLGKYDKAKVYLVFPESVNIGEISTGKVKSTIGLSLSNIIWHRRCSLGLEDS